MEENTLLRIVHINTRLPEPGFYLTDNGYLFYKGNPLRWSRDVLGLSTVETQPSFWCEPASPPSMPEISDDAIEKEAEKYTIEYCGGRTFNGAHIYAAYIDGAKIMRSQCDGLIKQKAVEFADFIYTKARKGYKPDCWFTGTTNDTKQFTTEELYEIFNQQER